MKARIENEKVVIYPSLPDIFHGVTATFPGGFHLQSKEVHEAEGFYEVVYPEIEEPTEKYGELYFSEGVFTCDILKKTPEEIAAESVNPVIPKDRIQELEETVEALLLILNEKNLL